MAVNRLIGGRFPGHDASHHKVKKSQAAEHSQRKVEQFTDGQRKVSSSPLSQDNDVELYTRAVGIVDDVDGQSVKPVSQGGDHSSLDKMPESISNAFQKGVEAKSSIEVRNAIGEYLREIMKSYSKYFPPAQDVSEKLYFDILTLSAKVMSFEFPAEKVSSRKKMIGLTAELLLQMQKALESSSPEFVNGQATAVLSVGLMMPDDRDFIFGTCLNMQVISVDKYNVDIVTLDGNIAKLNSKLAKAKAKAEAEAEADQDQVKELKELKESIFKATVARAELVSTRDRVKKESSGMHSQKDFFRSCYGIMMDKTKSDIRKNLKELLSDANPNAESNLLQRIMGKVKPALKSKAKIIASNTSNQKKGMKKEDVYQEKKADLLTLLREEMAVVLEEKSQLDNPEKPVSIETPPEIEVHGQANDAVDIESVHISVEDAYFPENKEVEEWANLLLEQVPVEERSKVDMVDLMKRLRDKALKMDIRDGLILPKGSESPFVRSSALRRAKRWKKETRNNSVTTKNNSATTRNNSVTNVLKKAKENNQEVQNVGPGSSVQMLIRYFTEIIEKERIE